MKNIKFNHDRLLKNISKVLVASSLLLLRFPCILVGYEPVIFALILLTFIESFAQLFIFSSLIDQKIPVRIMILLPTITMLVYLSLNYFIFVAFMIYFFYSWEKTKKRF